MRTFSLLTLALLLAACGSEPAPDGSARTPGNEPVEATPAADATAETDGLIGTWREVGRKSAPDGALRENTGIIVWTFRDDGTAFHSQTFENMGPVTEDHTWTLNGTNLIVSNEATGDERFNFEITERGEGTMTLFHADRSTYHVLERGE